MGANAQTSVPAFTAGQVLTAAQVTGINTGIPVFASSTERDAAFGGTGEKTLAEGQMAYLEDTDVTQYYDGSSWAAVGQAGGKILQVVSDLASSFSTTSLSLVDTNASLTITPSSATSKILVFASVYASRNSVADRQVVFAINRDGSLTPSGGEARYTSAVADARHSVMLYNLDSPASTSALTYTLQMRVTAGTGFIETNHIITAMEVGA